MFDVKKFTAFIVFNDELRNLYYDEVESKGIVSNWDVYHIQEGTELPSPKELIIMNDIFDSHIKSNEAVLKAYTRADLDFRDNVSRKIKRNPRN